MSDIAKVIAQMRQYVHRDDDGNECRASGHTLTSWANTLERLIQQPEQGSDGRDRSDESDVQSAAVLKEVKSRIAHKIANWSSMNERELLWCLLQLTETLEVMLQRKAVDGEHLAAD